MADPERMFCHVCRHVWRRDEHALECPECNSDFVEMIEPDHDPREESPDSDERMEDHDRLPLPLHNLPPWNLDPPDPDEGDIEHVEWNAGPNLTFSRTSYRSSTPGFRPSGPGFRSSTPGLDTSADHRDGAFGSFFQSFSSIVEGAQAPRQGGVPNRQNRSPRHSPRSPEREPPPLNLFPPRDPGSAPISPREGAPGQGFSGRSTFTTRTRFYPRDGTGGTLPPAQDTNMQGILGSLLQSIHAMNQQNQQNPNGPNPAILPIHLFARLLDPANAAHGDAVYTEEALDRVITQFMEQAQGSGAPGPASAEAISKLPKRPADKNMMGSDGKAECSVCMDNVEIGDEVTVLPCSHWFHGECVGAWLREHDTCPHCRQGIMPAVGDDGASPSPPRFPDQTTRSLGQSPPSNPGTEGGREFQITYSLPRQPQFHRSLESQSRLSLPELHRRRSRESRNGGEGSSGSAGGGGGGGSAGAGSGSGGGGGGLSGWVRDRWRGSDRS